MNTDSLIPVMRRVPPGDRWEWVGSMNATIYSSLTEALNAVFLLKNVTVFLVNAKEGFVYVGANDDMIVTTIAPPKKYSLYDES
jgi:predicted regulator of Ras-like GTPase activity (Roadblock/LC7/MglB family)